MHLLAQRLVGGEGLKEEAGMDALADQFFVGEYNRPTKRPGLSGASGWTGSLIRRISWNADGGGPQTSICCRTAAGAAVSTSEPPRLVRADRKDSSALAVRAGSSTLPETKPIPRVGCQAAWASPTVRSRGASHSASIEVRSDGRAPNLTRSSAWVRM